MQKGSINPNLIAAKISEMRQSLERLYEISSKGKAAFFNKPDLRDSAKYRLITAIETKYKLGDKEKENIKLTIKEIFESITEVRFAFLYGSFLEKSSFHDIDVAVFLNYDRLPEDLFSYELSLSSLLEERIKLPIDVKILNRAPLAFRYEVTRGEVIFSRDDDARFRFIEKTWNEYFDYRPVAMKILQDLAG